jgi:hypothetical protein
MNRAVATQAGFVNQKLLFDFVTDKVIIDTARERKASRTRANQRRLQRLAGAHATPQ